MISAILLTAMLSGLCAGAVASPISNVSKNRTVPVIKPDLNFNAGARDNLAFDGALPDEDQPQLVTTGIEFEETVDSRQLDFDGNQPPGSQSVPEPPPGALLTIGLIFLGIIALWRSAHRHKRRIRRTVLRMREIMAVR